jgi:hypothetical protein
LNFPDGACFGHRGQVYQAFAPAWWKVAYWAMWFWRRARKDSCFQVVDGQRAIMVSVKLPNVPGPHAVHLEERADGRVVVRVD